MQEIRNPKASKPSARRSRQSGQNLATPGLIVILFVVLVFLLGGGSRSDIASLPLLRAASVMFMCWAIAGMESSDWRRIRVPLALLLALTAWIALQLVPLPPSIWQGLPGRETIVAIDRLLGQADLWRPISLTPSDTWNSLLGMTLPLAALLLVVRLDTEDYSRLLTALVVIAAVSALLGFLQVLLGPGNATYLYRITNSHAMVGLFANRNHHALMQAWAVLIAASLLRDELMRKRQRKSVQLFLALAALLSTAMTVMTGSRAGLVFGFVAFVIGYAMILPAWRTRPIGRHGDSRPLVRSRSALVWAWAPPLLLGALSLTIISLADRSTSLSRLAEQSVALDLRVLAWPTVQHMVSVFWATGSGFGSFPDAYKMYEPDSLLLPSYFNHAHNDFAEMVITGGLPFVLIALLAVFWIARRAVAHGLRNLVKGYRGDNRLALLGAIVLLVAASIVDYPLRVPSLQVFAVMAVILLCCPRAARARD